VGTRSPSPGYAFRLRVHERLALVVSPALWVLSCALPTPVHGPIERPPSGPRDSFVVIGDTQRSLWVEEHVVGREQNDRGRVELVDQLVSQENPAFVVHLGDLVAKASPPHFRYFDELMAPIRAARIPIFPVLGNHEYFGEGRDPSRAMRLRFRDLNQGGYYAKRWGRIGLVWLDSNLSGRAAARQSEWLRRTLLALDRSADVTYALIFSHHSPFTNGVDRHGHLALRRELLPWIRASAKAVAVLSAHVHGYERFDLQGLSLIVSGGGGGPRVRYRTGAAQSLPPATPTLDTPAVRPLNYLVVRDDGNELQVTARCLAASPGCPQSGVLDQIALPPRSPDG
jgi:3',5'-cyclic AMP phosphodiesterase CpdA